MGTAPGLAQGVLPAQRPLFETTLQDLSCRTPYFPPEASTYSHHHSRSGSVICFQAINDVCRTLLFWLGREVKCNYCFLQKLRAAPLQFILFLLLFLKKLQDLN